MNNGIERILDLRSDMSDYVFHFTKGPHSEAKETLIKILNNDKIVANVNTGVICFTEAPIFSLVELFEYFRKFPKPMYSPYGIAVRKDEFYKLGGRPAIYGDFSEKKLLDSSITWRFVEYSPNKNDYSWLREWRINSPEINLSSVKKIIITKTFQEELDLAFSYGDLSIDGCVSDGQFFPEYSIEAERKDKTLSIEFINNQIIKNRKDVDNALLNQTLTEKIFIPLGS